MKVVGIFFYEARKLLYPFLMKDMTLLEHLEELRNRVIRIVIILAISFFICYGISAHISHYLILPLKDAIGAQGKIVFTGLLDKVLAELQISFWSSILLSSPLWFREIWLFIKPALYEAEVKIVRPFLVVGFLLFIAGVAFGYFVVFPFGFKTIMEYGVQDVEAMMNIKDYLLLASKILVFLGLLFQMPNILVILGFMGVVTKYSLHSMRRYLYVAFAVFAAIITPPDVLSMMVVWLPMIVLYEIGLIAVALIVHPYLKRKHMGEEKN
jgi:sec-independent protein translocase protein TatC